MASCSRQLIKRFNHCLNISHLTAGCRPFVIGSWIDRYGRETPIELAGAFRKFEFTCNSPGATKTEMILEAGGDNFFLIFIFHVIDGEKYKRSQKKLLDKMSACLFNIVK